MLNLAGSVFILAVARASAGRLAEVLTAPVRASEGTLPVSPGPLRLVDVTAGPLRSLSLTVAEGEVLGVVAADVVAAETLNGLLTGLTRPERGEVLLGGEPLAVAVGRLAADRAAGRAAHRGPVRSLPGRGGRLRRRADGGCSGRRPWRRPRSAPWPTTWTGRCWTTGMNLSGGQRQRIALARALLADRTVLVLRDPTTAVDAVTENAIATGIRRLRHPARLLT